jgi:hypothetical protein
VAAHDPGLDEAVETGLEDVGRDAQAALEVAVAGRAPEHGVANDQQAPAFADHFQGAGDRAHL